MKKHKFEKNTLSVFGKVLLLPAENSIINDDAINNQGQPVNQNINPNGTLTRIDMRLNDIVTDAASITGEQQLPRAYNKAKAAQMLIAYRNAIRSGISRHTALKCLELSAKYRRLSVAG